jgi:hypothetical protein
MSTFSCSRIFFAQAWPLIDKGLRCLGIEIVRVPSARMV